jgi:hypothetical protein
MVCGIGDACVRAFLVRFLEFRRGCEKGFTSSAQALSTPERGGACVTYLKYLNIKRQHKSALNQEPLSQNLFNSSPIWARSCADRGNASRTAKLLRVEKQNINKFTTECRLVYAHAQCGPGTKAGTMDRISPRAREIYCSERTCRSR